LTYATKDLGAEALTFAEYRERFAQAASREPRRASA